MAEIKNNRSHRLLCRPNQIRTLPRVVSGVALPYNPPQPRSLRTGLAACGGEEQDHAAE
jgi:hypothetical protein